MLVLDNLEQVVGARQFIADLVSQAPASRVLGTSRLRLDVRGEVVVTLDPLVLPASPDDLERSGASRLFLARARERGRLGPLSEEDRRAVVEICRRLDGLPLALELGAAWTRLLRPPAILRRLEAGRLTLAGDDRPPATRASRPSSTRPSAWSRQLIAPCSRASQASPVGSTSRRRLRSAGFRMP